MTDNSIKKKCNSYLMFFKWLAKNDIENKPAMKFEFKNSRKRQVCQTLSSTLRY